MGKFSREKGVRGERDVARRIPGAKREGVSFKQTIVDVSWNGRKDVAQVKNKTIGGATITDNLEKLEKAEPKARHYVIFKCKGRWLVCQDLEQFLKD